MITQTARVIALDGSRATLALNDRSQCAACARGQGCGIAFSSIFGRRQQHIRVPAEADWVLGQQLGVSIDHRHVLALAAIGYGLPLLGLLAGISVPAVMGWHSGGDWLALLFGMVGCYLPLRWSRSRLRVAPIRIGSDLASGSTGPLG